MTVNEFGSSNFDTFSSTTAVVALRAEVVVESFLQELPNCVKKKNIYNENRDHDLKPSNIIYCKDCGLILSNKKSLKRHENHCDKQKFNNIYTFEKKKFGKSIYGKNGGDIYLIQPIYNEDKYIIGVHNNLYNLLRNIKNKYKSEPLLYYYYPCKNVNLTKYHIDEYLNVFSKNNILDIRINILKIQQKINGNKEEIEPIVNRVYNCLYCKKLFIGKKEIFHHLSECNQFKNKLFKNDENNYELQLLKQELKELSKENIELKKTQTNVNNINNITNNTNIINNVNITINGYKNENLTYITNNVLSELCKIPFSSIQNLLKYIHFNENHPENMNVKITNRKEPYAKIYNGKIWELKDKKEIIDDMVNRGYNMIGGYYDEEKEHIKDSLKERFEIYQKNIMRMINM